MERFEKESFLVILRVVAVSRKLGFTLGSATKARNDEYFETLP